MAYIDRKLLPGPINLSHPLPCPIEFCISTVKNLAYCGRICVPRCPKICSPFPPDFFSPPPPPPPPQTEVQSHSISPFVIIIVAILGGTFLLVCYYAIILKYCSNWNSLRRRSDPQLDDTHEDFIDENHGPVIDHPIWFINTVGLQNSIINSITVCKYKKEEGLIEGTECSVCLNEFQDDETLRLLPKCSHAFHLPCIDTWLRSHTNCPLCRAPIVVNATGSTFTVTERNSNNLDSEGETLVEIPESHGGSGIDQIGGSNLNEIIEENKDEGELGFNDGRRVIDVAKEGASSSNHVNSGFRVFSDLTEIGRLGEDDIQPLRRSASMDSSFASLICFSLANFHAEESEGSSRNQLVRVKRGNSDILPKQGRGNLAISKLMGSSSMRRTLQKGPISMKRSLSYGGKFLFRNNQKSILPL